jgi:hypothetical protein
MGINLALAILEGTAHGYSGRHGGRSEAIDELIRESFWMTDEELTRAHRWAVSNGSVALGAAVEGERAKRKTSAPVSARVN